MTFHLTTLGSCALYDDKGDRVNVPKQALLMLAYLYDCRQSIPRISEILDVPVMFFFESASDDAFPSREALADFRLAKHHRAVLRTALSGIEDKRLRAKILAFVQSSEPDNER
jgi:hypothetical protein